MKTGNLTPNLQHTVFWADEVLADIISRILFQQEIT